MRRESAELPDQSAIGKDLIAGADFGNVERHGLSGWRHDNAKPVPRKAGVVGITLHRPWIVWAEQLPGGVVIIRTGPPELAVRIVAGVKAPKVMDFHDGFTFILKVDDLRASGRNGHRREQCSRNPRTSMETHNGIIVTWDKETRNWKAC